MILHESVDRDQVDDAMQQNGWRLVNIVQAGDGFPSQLIFVSRDRSTLFYFVGDERLGVLYFALVGGDVDRVEREVRDSLTTYAEGDIDELARDDSPSALGRAVRYRALTAPPAADEATLALFRRALAHDDPGVQSAARVASAYVPWPELARLVEAETR